MTIGEAAFLRNLAKGLISLKAELLWLRSNHTMFFTWMNLTDEERAPYLRKADDELKLIDLGNSLVETGRYRASPGADAYERIHEP